MESLCLAPATLPLLPCFYLCYTSLSPNIPRAFASVLLHVLLLCQDLFLQSVCMCVHVHECVCACACVRVHTRVWLCVHVCVCVHMCTCGVGVCVCVCLTLLFRPHQTSPAYPTPAMRILVSKASSPDNGITQPLRSLSDPMESKWHGGALPSPG